MNRPTSGPEWDRRVAEALDEAGMPISAGTGRGDYDPSKSIMNAANTFTADDLAQVKSLVARYSKLQVIDLIASLEK
jgi:hypothetical protein